MTCIKAEDLMHPAGKQLIHAQIVIVAPVRNVKIRVLGVGQYPNYLTGAGGTRLIQMVLPCSEKLQLWHKQWGHIYGLGLTSSSEIGIIMCQLS